jgi:hypothetical protein
MPTPGAADPLDILLRSSTMRTLLLLTLFLLAPLGFPQSPQVPAQGAVSGQARSHDRVVPDLAFAAEDTDRDGGDYVAGDGPGPCFCLEVTFIGHGGIHVVTYQLCGAQDMQNLNAILRIAVHLMQMQLIKRRVPCP